MSKLWSLLALLVLIDASVGAYSEIDDALKELLMSARGKIKPNQQPNQPNQPPPPSGGIQNPEQPTQEEEDSEETEIVQPPPQEPEESEEEEETVTSAPDTSNNGCSHGLTSDDIAKFRSRVNVSVSVGDEYINIYSNGWPDHAYGPFPSRENPNALTTQNHDFEVPLCPVLDASGGSCLPPGAIGVAVNGITIYNPFNINGEDALEVEVMDACDGHPSPNGDYHYHGHPSCIDDGGAETLIGVAYDGIPIVGPYNADGSVTTSADLDECHGETLPDGTYRYRATFDYPYLLGCFRGEVPALASQQSRNNCLFAKRSGIYQRSMESKYMVSNDDIMKRLLEKLERLNQGK